MKTTKAGTYNVWVALVPAGAAQPVSPVKTALVFLAGPPDATNTTVSTDKSAANADNKEPITLTLTPRDSHNNVVPLWTFSKDLTIVPSVNATEPGAVTVTTPAQDAAGNVAATLTYVDTSGKLLSKEARAGTTTIAIGSAVKKTFDTRFYPQVNVCLTYLDSNGFVTPGTTEVHLCDAAGKATPSGSGYKVSASGLSPSGCPADGGGVCPSDTAGVKADFENLTGDDIRTLAGTRVSFIIHDSYSGKDMSSAFPDGDIAFYGELKHHKPAANLATSHDLFHVDDAQAYCKSVVRLVPTYEANGLGAALSGAVLLGHATGGAVSTDSDMATPAYEPHPGRYTHRWRHKSRDIHRWQRRRTVTITGPPGAGQRGVTSVRRLLLQPGLPRHQVADVTRVCERQPCGRHEMDHCSRRHGVRHKHHPRGPGMGRNGQHWHQVAYCHKLEFIGRLLR
ncbi:hypothetical protein V8G21_005054 [Salmonella enterica]